MQNMKPTMSRLQCRCFLRSTLHYYLRHLGEVGYTLLALRNNVLAFNANAINKALINIRTKYEL